MDMVEHTSRTTESIEGCGLAIGSTYAAPHRRITRRVATLDVPPPTFMRAPGECPCSFGAEAAVDEFAVRLGIDPIDQGIRKEPDVDPASALP